MAFNPNQPRAKNGEWGTGDGGPHAAGVNGVGKPAVTKRAIDAILKAPGGISVTPDGKSPKDGYMVAVQGRTTILNGHELLTNDAPHVISEFARKNADLLGKPGAHIGVWKDDKSGKVYLDVANNVHGKFTALKAGKAANQIAIYDVKRGREIRTGGTGE